MIGPVSIALAALVAGVTVLLGLHDGRAPHSTTRHRPVSTSACVDLFERAAGPVPCPPTYGVGIPGLGRHVTD